MRTNSNSSRPKSAYTVFGVFDDGEGGGYRAFGEIFHTHNGAPAAEDLTRQWLEMSYDDLSDVIIAAVIPEIVATTGVSPTAPEDRFAAHRKISDESALDRMAKLLNLPGPWSGGDVCEALCKALIETGRHVDTDL